MAARINFASTKHVPDYPDFLDIQVKSFQDFFQIDTKSDARSNEGLYSTFKENFPISDTRNQFVLEFLDYFVDPPRYGVEECIERGLTYSVPLKARLKLYCTDPEHEDFETIVQDVYLGTIPYMTGSGTFIINGAETSDCFSVTPFARGFLRAVFPRQWYQALFGSYHSFQGFLD